MSYLVRILLAGVFPAVSVVAAIAPSHASSVLISSGSEQRAPSEVEADYTTSHLFIDEVAKDTVPITVFFNPQTNGVATAEVFTNLNRRDFVTASPNGNGVEEGIEPPNGNTIAAGDDSHYYKAYTMAPVAGGYLLTLRATKTGVYRLTARFRLTTDAPGVYHWYSDEQNAQGIPKRDHAIVVSPSKARDVQLYEANPLTITATGTSMNQRGTFAGMAIATPSAGGPRFSVTYLKQLGVNALWLQPIHPREIADRQGQLGSPYGVKNLFAAMPLMASSFTPGATPASQDTPQGRDAALAEFQNFVRAADAQGLTIFLDAPFDHTAHDAELGTAGQGYWGNAGSNATSEIPNVEARVYSRLSEYDQRASSAANIAPAPDRFDFGKWPDVSHIYFGRYAALVPNQGAQNNYTNEGDWFDYSVGDENGTGQGNGHFDQITQRVWRFFGDYLQNWLSQTGYPDNVQHATLDATTGIGGLRADFAQGIPPQAWEYIINRTRARRWDFMFLAESLDGGPVTYRSGRQFDILNDNLVYGLHTAINADDFQGLYQQRSQAYAGGLVLLNTTSQDEDNYKDPYEAALRFAVNSTAYGATLIFPGQELGLRGTMVPPNGNPTNSQPFGYDRFQLNFGKFIPDFESFNSMMPLWRQLDGNTGDAVHLLAFYTAVSQARRASPALRSANTWYLNLKGGAPDNQIFGVGKVDKPGSAASDIIFAFVNLAIGSNSTTPGGAGFDVNVSGPQGNVFGIRPDHTYNARNIAAVTDQRRNVCLWGSGRSGSDLLQNGIFVSLNPVPGSETGWDNAPFEAQYLKLIDVTSGGECGAPAGTKRAVVTRSYDNGRSGANTEEHVLTPAAIKSRGLTKAYSLTIAGDDPNIEAQPLYVPDVKMADGTTHDVVYLFSMSDNVWAFDAANGAPLWPHPVSLGKPFIPVPGDPVDSYRINKSFGVLSTAVIDRESGTAYAVSWIVDAQGNRQLKLNAISLRDGRPPAGKETPLAIEGSVRNDKGQTITLSQVQKQRAALLLVPLGARSSPAIHRIVYVAITGDDTPPPQPDATLGHHGWVVALDVDAWREVAAWLPTPNSFGGGIWQSSQGLAADDAGNVYGITSNGGFLVNQDGSKIDFNGKTDFGESFFKLSLRGNSLVLADWFSPFRDSARKTWTMPEVAPFASDYNYEDQDVGSGGAVLPPASNLILGAGKDGVLYVLDRGNLGKAIGDFTKLKAPPVFLTFDPSSPVYDGASPTGNLDFKPQQGLKTHHLHGSPVYWVSSQHGPMLFAWGENGELRAFSLDSADRAKLLAHGTELASGPLATAPGNLGGMPGGMLTVSANGQSDGIVWGTAPIAGDANKAVVDGIVRAYDAADFDPATDQNGPQKMHLLWQQAGFKYSKFCPPVVADGRLFVPTYDGRVDVYQLK